MAVKGLYTANVNTAQSMRLSVELNIFYTASLISYRPTFASHLSIAFLSCDDCGVRPLHPPSPPGLCSNTCSPNYSGCQDGGTGSYTDTCALGTDCDACGIRFLHIPPPSPPPPSPPGCSNSCTPTYQISNGLCQDGGDGSEYSHCDFATDCADCGPRLQTPPPTPPPPAPPGSLCSNDCPGYGLGTDQYCELNGYCPPAGNGKCQDGGQGAHWSHCPIGTEYALLALERTIRKPEKH